MATSKPSKPQSWVRGSAKTNAPYISPNHLYVAWVEPTRAALAKTRATTAAANASIEDDRCPNKCGKLVTDQDPEQSWCRTCGFVIRVLPPPVVDRRVNFRRRPVRASRHDHPA